MYVCMFIYIQASVCRLLMCGCGTNLTTSRSKHTLPLFYCFLLNCSFFFICITGSVFLLILSMFIEPEQDLKIYLPFNIVCLSWVTNLWRHLQNFDSLECPHDMLLFIVFAFFPGYVCY